MTLRELLVLNDDLRFAVWSEPGNLSRVSLLSHSLANLVGEVVRKREESLSVPLVGGISEHESLISCTHIFFFLVSSHGSSNVGILSLNVDNELAVFVVETNFLRSVADFSADSSANFLEVDSSSIDGNFSK